MGLVFASRRTGIDPDQFNLIAVDDGYRKLPVVGDAIPGDLAVYLVGEEVRHVGLVLSVTANVATASHDIVVLSQFGRDGEYIHALDDLPEGLAIGGQPKTSIWTERDREP
jgi:hypothetical protein